MGPLPTANGSHQGHKYILTMYDAFSHFLVAVPIPNKEAKTIFLEHIVLQGRMPMAVTTDNGTEFMGEFKASLAAFKVRHGCTIPYHPQSNFTERVHRYINGSLRAMVIHPRTSQHGWADMLPYIVYAYNRRPLNGTKISPYMLRTGRQPMLPDDVDKPHVQSLNKSIRETLEDKIKRINTRTTAW